MHNNESTDQEMEAKCDNWKLEFPAFNEWNMYLTVVNQVYDTRLHITDPVTQLKTNKE